MGSEWGLGQVGFDGAPGLTTVETVSSLTMLRSLDDLGEANQKVVGGDGAKAKFTDAWRIDNVGVGRR